MSNFRTYGRGCLVHCCHWPMYDCILWEYKFSGDKDRKKQAVYAEFFILNLWNANTYMKPYIFYGHDTKSKMQVPLRSMFELVVRDSKSPTQSICIFNCFISHVFATVLNKLATFPQFAEHQCLVIFPCWWRITVWQCLIVGGTSVSGHVH